MSDDGIGDVKPWRYFETELYRRLIMLEGELPSEIKEMKTQKSWGHELMVHNDQYCCKLLVYEKSIASSLHYHERKHETFVVLSGEFIVSRVGHSMKMGPGDRLVIPPMTPHRVRCLEPGTIVESSSYDDPADCVRLSPSEE